MRIVHFSDIHFGLWPEHIFRAIFDKRILGLINYFIRRRGQFHHELITRARQAVFDLRPQLVVCTGDIASISSEREFQAAGRVLKPLVNHPDFTFIYVPGNHDHYVRSPHCQRAFAKTFQKLNNNRWKLSDLPTILDIENNEIMVCDECRPTNIFLSSGYIGPELEHSLKTWLDRPRIPGKRRILVGHYPTRDSEGKPLSWRRRLNGGEQILEALQSGKLDLSLCGHIHQPFMHRAKKAGGVEICAGSLTLNGVLNIIDLPDNLNQGINQRWQNVGQPFLEKQESS